MTKPEFWMGKPVLGGGVAGTPSEGAADLMFALLSSARSDWHSCAFCEYWALCDILGKL